jgi:hypothetical protein
MSRFPADNNASTDKTLSFSGLLNDRVLFQCIYFIGHKRSAAALPLVAFFPLTWPR